MWRNVVWMQILYGELDLGWVIAPRITVSQKKVFVAYSTVLFMALDMFKFLVNYVNEGNENIVYLIWR